MARRGRDGCGRPQRAGARRGRSGASPTRLRLADEAAAALASLPDTPELRLGEDDGPAAAMAQDCAPANEFEAKIVALAQTFVDAPPPDFAKASFAELFAWALAQPPAE